MRKEAIVFLSLILLIPLISAQFSISEVFSFFDAQTIFFIVCFGVLGLLLSTILNRFPAFRGPTAGVMSLLLSLGMTYGINKWLNVNDLFSGLGFSGDILPYLLIALLILIIIGLFIFKGKTFVILGLLLILIALFTDWVVETGVVLIIGIILFLIGLIWWWISRRKKIPTTPQEQVIYQQRQRSLYDLKQKYMAYLFYYNRRGLTKHERKRIRKAMYIIIDYARKVGVSEREFLSSKFGGTNAKSPGSLRSPFDG